MMGLSRASWQRTSEASGTSRPAGRAGSGGAPAGRSVRNSPTLPGGASCSMAATCCTLFASSACTRSRSTASTAVSQPGSMRMYCQMRSVSSPRPCFSSQGRIWFSPCMRACSCSSTAMRASMVVVLVTAACRASCAGPRSAWTSARRASSVCCCSAVRASSSCAAPSSSASRSSWSDASSPSCDSEACSRWRRSCICASASSWERRSTRPTCSAC